MENNENNVQNQEKKQSKGLSVGLVVIMLIAVLIIGIGGGYLLSKNDSLFSKNETKSNGNNSNTNQSDNNTSTQNNTTEQIKVGKKIDESKPWVYDAEYLKNKEEKKISIDYSNETFSTLSNLKIPYINVDSEEAKKANQEIENIAIEQYNKFGKQDGEITYYITSIDYLYSYNGDNLSVLMFYNTNISGTGSKIDSIKSYNLKLDNKNNEDKDNIGGYSKDSIKSKIDEFSKKENSEGDKLNIVDGEYFIYNNQLYVICTGGYTSGGVRSSYQYTLFDVNNTKEIPYYQIKEVLENKKSQQNQTKLNDNSKTKIY